MSETNEGRRSTRTLLPLHYYEGLFKLLIAGLTVGLTHVALAETLNEQGITTHTGLEWTGASVKLTLRNLRDPARYPAATSNALAALIASKQLTVDEAKPLYELRNQ